MSNNITKYNRISKDVTVINDSLLMRHTIVLNSKIIRVNDSKRVRHYYEYGLKSDYPPYSIANNVVFKVLTQYISLECKIFDNGTKKDIKCRIYYKDFPGILDLINRVKKTFDTTNDLFMISMDNKIIDINEKYRKHIEIMFFKGSMANRFLSIKPNVLVDRNTVYPSVILECNDGILGNITFDEFLTLKLALEEYIRNFHTLSNQLLNTAYLHAIGYPSDAEDIHELK